MLTSWSLSSIILGPLCACVCLAVRYCLPFLVSDTQLSSVHVRTVTASSSRRNDVTTSVRTSGTGRARALARLSGRRAGIGPARSLARLSGRRAGIGPVRAVARVEGSRAHACCCRRLVAHTLLHVRSAASHQVRTGVRFQHGEQPTHDGGATGDDATTAGPRRRAARATTARHQQAAAACRSGGRADDAAGGAPTDGRAPAVAAREPPRRASE